MTAHMSPSQINSLLTCGEQFRLKRRVGVPDRPGWGGIGGTVVHRLTEYHDLGIEPMPTWQQAWDQVVEEQLMRTPEWGPADYYISGRKSKAWPNKEDPEWWAHHGPGFVVAWAKWVDESGLTIPTLTAYDGTEVFGVEVPVEAVQGEHKVVCYIDRVFEDSDGKVLIVDIKSGTHMDAWARQLMLNNLGLKHTFGLSADFGGYWKARAGGVDGWTVLRNYPDQWLWNQVENASRIRDEGLFLPQPNNLCKSACGVADWCLAVGGTPHPDDPLSDLLTQQ